MSRTPGIPNGSRLAAFHHLCTVETDACVIWPYATNSKGYGQVGIEGRVRTVHSVVAEKSAPRPLGYHAAHTCGVKRCMNYRHIRWATPKENEADKRLPVSAVRKYLGVAS